MAGRTRQLAGGFAACGAVLLSLASLRPLSADWRTSGPPTVDSEQAFQNRQAAWSDGYVPAAYEEPLGPVAGPSCDHLAGCEPCDSHWHQFSLFAGLDGSKQPQDLGVNAHMGARLAVNWGLRIWEDAGLGFQIGEAVTFSDHAVQVVERIEGTSDRFQSFTTLGLFQRTECGLGWGVVYDYLTEDYYDQFELGQWRAQVGYLVNDCNEIGVWSAFGGEDDDGLFGATPVTLSPIMQGSVYWRHTWASRAETTIWLGISEGHGEVNVALGDYPPTGERLTYGADLHVPLNDWMALFGEANFITPADTGTVDAYLGFVFYPGGGAALARRERYAPFLPVASSPTFSVDLAR